jgi:hypothetical protein
MTHQSAEKLYALLSTTQQVELKRDLDSAAVAYAHWRAQWAMAAPDGRRDMDAARSASHNVLIDSCNVLARAMTQAGEDSSWRNQLGNDRKVIGDFGCYVAYALAVSAR